MRRLVGLAVVGLATLAPTWAHADDEQIAQEIIQKLEAKKDAGLMKGFGIDLEVENGTVIMKGVVATTDQRNMALDIARRVSGVEKVVNGLALKPGAPATATKAPIEESKAPQAAPRMIELTTKPQEVDDEAVTVPEFQPIGQRSAATVTVPAQPFNPPPLDATPTAQSRMRSSNQSPAQTGNDMPGNARTDRAAQAKTPAKGGFFNNLSRTISSTFSDSSDNSKSGVRQVAHTDPELTQKPVKKAAATLPADSIDDDQITNSFRNWLNQEKKAGRLVGFYIEAKSTGGNLLVSGHVSNYDQHLLVIEKARRINGVKQVVNNLKVSGGSLERIATTTERNDPSTPYPEGTGVAKRSSRNAPYVEAVPVPTADTQVGSGPLSSGPSTLNARMSGTLPQDPAGGNPQGMRAVPVPVQFVPVQMSGMPQQYQGMPPQYAGQYQGMPPQYQGMYPQYAGMPQTPLAFAQSQGGGRTVQAQGMAPAGNQGPPMPTAMPTPGGGVAAARYDHPNMPGYAWPSYAAYPNYAAVTYPKQYSPSAWPYIGPFYPYPQVPLGWRKVSLEWDDGWWMLDFKDKH